MWEVQRCDRMWGKSPSAKQLKRAINTSVQLQLCDTCLSAGGFQLQEHCDCTETDFLLCANPWRKPLGERDILPHLVQIMSGSYF